MKTFPTKQARNRELRRRRAVHAAKRPPSARTLSDEHKAALQAGKERGHEARAAAKLAKVEAIARRRTPYPDSHPAIRDYRREKKRRDKSVAKLIAEAKLEMARLDELNKLARRGGRPKKVVNG